MSTFSNFIPCIHGGLASTCTICTGVQKLMVRFNEDKSHWEMYGFVRGRLPVRWKWIAVSAADAHKMLQSGNFVRIDYQASLNMKGDQHAA